MVISLRTAMFSFRESYFRLVGLFDWVYARTKFLLSVSRNRYDFTLAGYRNEKSATDPALVLDVWDGKQTYRKSWAEKLLVLSDLTLGPSFKIK